MSIPIEEAKKLYHDQIIYAIGYTNADGSPQRFRVNGIVKRWKRSPNRVCVPLKRGLWEFGYLENHNLDDFALTESKAVRITRELAVP